MSSSGFREGGIRHSAPLSAPRRVGKFGWSAQLALTSAPQCAAGSRNCTLSARLDSTARSHERAPSDADRRHAFGTHSRTRPYGSPRASQSLERRRAARCSLRGAVSPERHPVPALVFGIGLMVTRRGGLRRSLRRRIAPARPRRRRLRRTAKPRVTIKTHSRTRVAESAEPRGSSAPAFTPQRERHCRHPDQYEQRLPIDAPRPRFREGRTVTMQLLHQ